MSERDFTDFVSEGRTLMQARDKNSWGLGQLAWDFEITVGHPSDPDAPTLGDLAREWDASTQRVSEWRNCYGFYVKEGTDARKFDLSWSHYNQARRASEGDLDNALELLDMAVRLHMGTRAFERYIKGIYFEGAVPVGVLDVGLLAMIPSGVKEVWLVVRRNEA
jgi:hypothetical protein